MDNDIVLNELTDENLVLQMHDDMYDGLAANIGADAYCRDAMVAVETSTAFMKESLDNSL